MIRAMIVDDEILTLHMLKNIIPWARLGISLCAEAMNGMEANRLFVIHQLQLVITDIRMPQMDGLTLIQKIKKISPSTQIILISAHADFDYVKEAMHLGCSDYILKPIDEVELEETLRITVQKIRNQAIVDVEEGGKVYNRSVYQAIEMMKESYDKNLSLENICRQVALSKNYFCHLFKSETGESVWSYLTKYRLKEAKRLLRTTDLKSYEVAYKVGYDNPSYFSKIFKRELGMTPYQYRENEKMKEGGKVNEDRNEKQ